MRLEIVKTGTAQVIKCHKQLTEVDGDILPTVKATDEERY